MIIFNRKDLINVGRNKIFDEDGNPAGYEQAKSGITYSFKYMEDGFSWCYNFGKGERFMDFIKKHKSMSEFRSNFFSAN